MTNKQKILRASESSTNPSVREVAQAGEILDDFGQLDLATSIKQMTNKQKILRASEIKQRLDIISGYEGDGPPPTFTGKQPPEVEALMNELKDLEWAIAAESMKESMEEARREINQ